MQNSLILVIEEEVMFDFKKSKSLITILLSVMVSSCAYDQDQTEVDMDVVHQGDYGIWKQSVTDLFSSDYFPASQIRHKYAQTHAYHPVFMGQAWMNDMGELAAQNPAFREQLLDEVSGGREAAYAQKLLYNPQAITSLSSSRSAFRDVLNYVSYNNARYSDNQTRLEAYACENSLCQIFILSQSLSVIFQCMIIAQHLRQIPL